MFSPELLNAWRTCQPADPSQFEALPNGKYIVRIDAVHLDAARTVNGKSLPECLVYEMTVTEGEHARARCKKTDYINNETSLRYIKLDLNTLRCQIPINLTDIALALQRAVGTTVEIEVKRTTSTGGKEFVNTYIKRAVTVMQPPSDAQIDGYRQLARPTAPQPPQQQYPPQQAAPPLPPPDFGSYPDDIPY